DDDRPLYFFVTGVIEDKLLPPMKVDRVYKSNRGGAGMMRQSITLSGVGHPSFPECVDKLLQLHVQLSRVTHKLQSFPSPRIRPDHIEFDNAYFETGEDADLSQAVEFGLGVDPDGRLALLQGPGCRHTEENRVQFLKLEDCDEGKFIYSPMPPSAFKRGDVVRVGFTVTVKEYKNADRAAIFCLVLRSVTMVDASL
ncbi:hypothetical protein BD626DRAFT_355541, partial [Schizophyllum amplum]